MKSGGKEAELALSKVKGSNGNNRCVLGVCMKCWVFSAISRLRAQ